MDAKIMDAKIIDAKIMDGIFIGREIKKTRIYSRFLQKKSIQIVCPYKLCAHTNLIF